MFASRANQENVIYEQQTAAAAKPLNQGVKGLAPKTPANNKAAPKTPFNKVPLNDENAKTGGKGKQNGLFGEGKSAKVDGNAFVTPAGPRNRAPLGNKTTNAKATAFRTPAPAAVAPLSIEPQDKPSAKPSSPRMRRAKIKIHEAEAEAETSKGLPNDHEEEPDIEFMPPREIPLPDYPDDCWPHDRTYPQFEGRNLTRGWWSGFTNHDGDEDAEEELSDFEEKLKQLEERKRKEKLVEHGKKSPAGGVKKSSGLQKTTRDPLTAPAPQTLKARSAANALSGTTGTYNKSTSFAASTATSKSRAAPSSTMAAVPKKKLPLGTTGQPSVGNVRHGAARVASNSTLGYSKGRAVSSNTKKPMGEAQEQRDSVVAPVKTSLGDLFLAIEGLDIGDDDGDNDLGGGVLVLGEEDEDEALKDFQLDPVEI